MLKTILHLDMNSYFATAEQQANPYLRGKPVGIIKAEGRGCIIAASVEAKKFGVKTGTTAWDAKKLCPQIILVPSDMDKYFALTQRMIKILGGYSPILEVFSIDECFVDITDSQRLWPGGAFEMALELKQKIKENLGEWMKCSIGISFTKLLAKLASEIKKPDGLTFLTPESYLPDTENIAVSEVCGIGHARTVYLHSRGAYTLKQARLLKLPIEIEDLVWLRADDQLTQIDNIQSAKSVSRTFTTFASLNSQTAILKLVRNLVEEACMKLREMNMVGRTFCMSMDNLPAGRQGFWTRKTVIIPTDDPLIIYNLLINEYEKRPVAGLRQVGVYIMNLIFNFQFSIFKQRTELLKAVDVVNQKYGLFTMYPGVLLGGELIRPEVTGFLGDKYYRLLTKKF